MGKMELSWVVFLLTCLSTTVPASALCQCNGAAVLRTLNCKIINSTVMNLTLDSEEIYHLGDILKQTSCEFSKFSKIIFYVRSDLREERSIILELDEFQESANFEIINIQTVSLGPVLANRISLNLQNCTNLVWNKTKVRGKSILDSYVTFNVDLELVNDTKFLDLVYSFDGAATIEVRKPKNHKKSPCECKPTTMDAKISIWLMIPLSAFAVSLLVMSVIVYRKRQRITHEIKRTSRRISLAVASALGFGPGLNAMRVIEERVQEDMRTEETRRPVPPNRRYTLEFFPRQRSGSASDMI